MLDLAPNEISSPTNKDGDSSLDLTLETNYGTLVQAVLAAVNAANEIRLKMNLDDTTNTIKEEPPHQLQRVEVLSLFRPPPSATADEFPFQRRQPVILVGTKITTKDSQNEPYHELAIQSVLPAFKAAASAIDQLRSNYQNNISSPIQASQMAKAAASIDPEKDWTADAIALIQDGLDVRIETILNNDTDAMSWLDKAPGQNEDRNSRARLAQDIRQAELKVLQQLKEDLSTLES